MLRTLGRVRSVRRAGEHLDRLEEAVLQLPGVPIGHLVEGQPHDRTAAQHLGESGALALAGRSQDEQQAGRGPAVDQFVEPRAWEETTGSRGHRGRRCCPGPRDSGFGRGRSSDGRGHRGASGRGGAWAVALPPTAWEVGASCAPPRRGRRRASVAPRQPATTCGQWRAAGRSTPPPTTSPGRVRSRPRRRHADQPDVPPPGQGCCGSC